MRMPARWKQMKRFSNKNSRFGIVPAFFLRRFLVVAGGCGLFASCLNQDPMPMNTHQPGPSNAPSNQKIRYLALGDSYTIGEGEKRAHTYPEQVVQILTGEGWLFAPPRILAKTGWTTGELLLATNEQRLIEERFDAISLLIGVNNQYRGQPFHQFEEEFNALIDLCLVMVNGAGQRLVLLSIPDWGVTPFGKNGPQSVDQIALEIDSYNAFIQETASRRGLPFVEITTNYRSIGGLPENLVADGLHPSRYIYSDWARALSRIMKTGLQQHLSKTTKPDEN